MEMNDTKQIKELVELLWDDLQLLRASVDRIEAQVTQPAQERGNWRDLVEWLREIPGAPQLTKRRSIDCYCGEDKLFKPGEAYQLHNRRRIFIRSEVERVIREWAKIDR